MLEVGKLYLCEQYFLLLYPDQKASAVGAHYQDAARTSADDEGNAAVAYWSKRLGKPVLYVKKNIPILVLNSKEKFYEVLAGDRKGWIIVEDWLELKEIDYA